MGCRRMRCGACIAAGDHPNLVTVLARLDDSEQAGLVFSFISPDYKNLGGPPSLDTCTRDTYDAGVSFYADGRSTRFTGNCCCDRPPPQQGHHARRPLRPQHFS